jgi:filamentous hemagglutinin family protein
VPNGLTAGGLVAHSNPSTADIAAGLVWENANAPTQTTSGANTTVTVQQNAQKAILTWDSFNVGKNTTVHFDQTKGTLSDGSNTWIALNRVIDPTGVPSQILGNINAEGTVYLINKNGIIFGGSSQVNVHSLVASSLSLLQEGGQSVVDANQTFRTTGIGDPFSHGGAIFGTQNVNAPVSGDITIDAGAQIETGDAGFSLFAGGNVSNAGSIVANGGQAILAASTGVSFDHSGSNDASGHLTPVIYGFGTRDENGAFPVYTVVNTGTITGLRGDVTLTGTSVEQRGVVLATTSISRPGSITISGLDQNNTRGGTVLLGSGSLTTILPDANGETTSSTPAADDIFQPGSALIQGGSVWFQPDSLVEMPGANLVVNAPLLNPTPMMDAVPARIYIDNGAVIDAAGLTDVQLPMSANLVTVPRVGQNELADSPLQRDGIVYRSPFTVDSRDSGVRDDGLAWVGTPLLNASGYVQGVPRTVNQLLTDGGSITLQSGESTIAAPGSIIDVAGGYIHYQGGMVQTTRLLGADGRIYDAASADPLMSYTGLAGVNTVSHDRWAVSDTYTNSLFSGAVFESDYITGGNGGALSILVGGTGTPILDGTLDASATAGRYQVGGGKEPKGGSLSVAGGGIRVTADGVDFAGLGEDFGAGTILATPERLAQDTTDKTNLIYTANLPGDAISAAGFSSISLTADMVTLEQGATLSVKPGGSVSVTAARMDVFGDIIAHAGQINLLSTGITGADGLSPFGPAPGAGPVLSPLPPRGVEGAPPVAGDITLGSDTLLDVSGLWVNDRGRFGDDRTGSSFINGGSVSLQTTAKAQQRQGLNPGQGLGAYDTTGAIIVPKGAVLNASGGGYVDALGQVATKDGIPLGEGGDISLQTYVGFEWQMGDLLGPGGLVGAPPTHGTVQLDGTLKDFGFSGGGTLTLQTLGIQIGGEAAGLPDYVTWLPESYFADQGFGGYALSALYDATIAPGAQVRVSQRNYVADPGVIAALPSGTDLSAGGAVSLGVLDPYHRQATDFSLTGAGYLTWNGSSIHNNSKSRPDLDGVNGVVLMGEGAAILADGGANVTLSSYGQLTMLGSITAHGGSVTVQDFANDGDNYDFLSRSVWLGANSSIDVSGVALADPLALPVRSGFELITPQTGKVLAGGSVTLDGTNAYVVAEKGSRIDTSGATGMFDIPVQSSNLYAPVAYRREEIWSDAGNISLGSTNGLYYDGTLTGHGGNAQARGGSLTILDVGQSQGRSVTILVAKGILLQQSGDLVTDGMTAGGPIESGTTSSGVMHFVADRLTGSGIDTLALGGDPTKQLGGLPTIAFAGDVTLSLARAVTLNATSFLALAPGSAGIPTVTGASALTGGGHVEIDAPYVAIAGGGATNFTPVLPAGDATLNVHADMIDLMGQFLLQRFGEANFTSLGDIRLYNPDYLAYVGQSTTPLPGELITGGNLTFQAAQLYPATGSVFLLDAPIAGSTITFRGNGNATPPLSVGGALLVDAETIVQNGTIRAPSGTIQLGVGDVTDADIKTAFNNLPLIRTTSVTLGDGSLTSVSLDGRSLPYGTTTDGTDWKLTVTNQTGQQISSGDLTQAPQKLIGLAGDTVTLGSGTTIDLSGGGNVYAQEWVPGTGGSRDLLNAVNTSYSSGALAQAVPLYADNRPVYAVVPGNQSPVAAYDPSFGYPGSEIGKSIYLSGVKGLADGVYTLLPGQYAALPGAFRVVQNTAAQDTTTHDNHTLADGSQIISGRFVDGISGKSDPRSTSFVVQSADTWKQYSEYTLTPADTYFPAQAAHAGSTATRTPVDAGRLALAAVDALVLDGQLKATAGDKGRGAAVDISGLDIQIVGDNANVRDGYLQIDATSLSKLGAESVLIGGTRADGTDGTTITANAQSVILSNDSGSALTGPEILLVTRAGTGANAVNGLLLEEGSVIAAKGDIANASTLPILIGKDGGASGDGALLRVSNGAPVAVIRTNVPGQDGAAGTATGKLDIRSGVSIDGGKSAILDSSADLLLDPGAVFAGDAVDVNANSIAFVGTNGTAPTNGFVVGTQLLTQLANIQTLGLHSRTTMGFYGDVDLTTANALILGANAFTGDGGTVTITAPNLVLTNDIGSSSATFAAGSGTLNLKADELDFGAGAVTVQGFGRINATATQGIVGQGTGSFDFGTLDVAMTAPVFLADSGSNTQVTTTGALSLKRGVGTAIDRETLGGALNFSGGSLTTDAAIQAVAGNLTLGATSGDLNVADGAVLSAAGVSKTFFDTEAYAPGGTLTLTANTGAIAIAANATLDFSGAAKGGDAGGLTVSAAGAVTLDGQLNGHAIDGYRGGRFTLASGAAIDLDRIADLSAASGFTGGLSVTSGAGNLTLSAGKTIKAQVIYLSANGGAHPSTTDGNVIVNGTLDVSSTAAGHIDLYGSSGVDVEGSLLAVSSVPEQDGGVVTIGTSGATDGGLNIPFGYENVQAADSGTIRIGTNALIDVSGGSADAGGQVSLRAPLLANGDVAIAIDGTIRGAKSVTIEPYAVWSTTDASTGAQHFDGIIDPAGWYNADGTMVAGTWTDDQGVVQATPADDATLKTYLTNYYFTPDTANPDHVGFYGYNGGDAANGPGTLMGFVQQPGFAFSHDYAGIANLHIRPGMELRNPGETVRGGDIAILTNWNLAAGTKDPVTGAISLAYRYGNEAPILTVRAEHDLDIQASITDGFFQQNDGAAIQDTVTPPVGPSNLYNDALAAYQVSQDFIDNNPNAWNGTINLKSGSAAVGQTPGGGTVDITADPYYTPLMAPLADQTDAYYGNYNLYIADFGNGVNPNAGPGGGFLYRFNTANNAGTAHGFFVYSPTALIAPQPGDSAYATYADYLTAYASWLSANFATNPLAKRIQTPSPVLLPLAQDYGQYSSDYALYADGYNSYVNYVSTKVGSYAATSGVQLFYAPFAPRSDAVGSPAYQTALTAYQASKTFIDANNIWTGTINLKSGTAAAGMTPGGGTVDITADPYYTPIIAPLTDQSDAYYGNYQLYIGEVGDGSASSSKFAYRYGLANRVTSSHGFLVYSPTTLIAPQPGDSAYATYADYLTAYASWLSANFAANPVSKRIQTPSPVLLPIAPDYGQYSSDYALYATGYDTYLNYVSTKIGSYVSTSGVQLFYAPFAPREQAATGGGAPVVQLPIDPSHADNSPSNMPIAGSPVSLASATLLGGNSTSYRFIAGADFTATDPLALNTLTGAGSVGIDGHFAVIDKSSTYSDGSPIDPHDPLKGKTLVLPNVIRTGTGSIDIAAADDLTLLDHTAPGAIYTGGAPVDDTAGTGVTVLRHHAGDGLDNLPLLLVTAPVRSDNAGDITLNAGGDITGVQQVYDTDGTITKKKGTYIAQYWWQWMATGNPPGILPTDGSTINFGAFDQGVLSTGGNVSVHAGGDIRELSVSLPTTRQAGGDGKTIIGGGDLDVAAGGDILGGAYFVSKGQGRIDAGGSIGSAFTYTNTGVSSPVSTFLGLQDSVLTINARGDLDIGGIVNPSQIHPNQTVPDDGQSLTSRSELDLASTVGDVSILTMNTQQNLTSGGGAAFAGGTTALPATITMTAFDGGATVARDGDLYASPTGQLSILAEGDIHFVQTKDSTGGDSFGLGDGVNGSLGSGVQQTNPASSAPVIDGLLHAHDTQPVRIYSLDGDIISGRLETQAGPNLGLQVNGLQIISPKPAQIRAGGDIVNLTFLGQNLYDSDVTSIVAGGDIYDVNPLGDGIPVGLYNIYTQPGLIQLAGPGRLDIQAGRDLGPLNGNYIPFGGSVAPATGIQTIGNLYNPYLPRESADISVLFGTGPGVAWDAFAAAYVNPAAQMPGIPSVNAELIDTVAQYEADTNARNGAKGVKPNLSADQAWAIFQTLPQAQREAVVEKAFFKVLAVTGADYNDPSSPYFNKYARGYQAIEDLFPSALGYTANNLEGGANGAAQRVVTGNLDIRGTTIQTRQGGDINIMGPGGQLLIGSTSSPPYIPATAGNNGLGPEALGILALETGAVNIFSDSSLLLAQSRIFTERGGDMTIWSSNGDINAGKGVKTSAEIGPTQFFCDADFYCLIDASSQVTGAGIAAFPAKPGNPPPTVTLVAPRGTVDAGDAGIRVSGDLIIAAQSVANADNIQVEGKAIGLPPKPVTNLALTTASTAATEAASLTNAMKAQQPQTIVDVEITGFGGDLDNPDACVPSNIRGCAPAK